jgi:hypothetical protein
MFGGEFVKKNLPGPDLDSPITNLDLQHFMLSLLN